MRHAFAVQYDATAALATDEWVRLKAGMTGGGAVT
jgi:hypothetical protein